MSVRQQNNNTATTSSSLVLPKLSSDQSASHRRILDRIAHSDNMEAAVHRSSTGALSRLRKGSGAVRGVLAGGGVTTAGRSSSAMGAYREGHNGDTTITTTTTQPRSHSSMSTSNNNHTTSSLSGNEAARLLITKRRGMGELSTQHTTTTIPTNGSMTLLPQLPGVLSTIVLSEGLAVAAKIAGFSELQAHKVFDTDVSKECHLPLTTIQEIFMARSHDSAQIRHGGRASLMTDPHEGSVDGGDRLLRFVEYVATQCRGLRFDLSGCGLGEQGLAAVVDALIQDHMRQEEIDIAIQHAATHSSSSAPHSLEASQVGGRSVIGGGASRMVTFSTQLSAPGGVRHSSSQHQQPAAASSSLPPSTQVLENLYNASFECPPYACVDLSENISTQVGHQLAKLVAQNPCIVSLTAKSMALSGSNGACEFFYNMGVINNTIVHLDLSGEATGSARNAIWGPAGAALAQMVRDNQVLARLNLSHCGLEPNDMISLFRACKKHVALQSLDVGGNGMDGLAVCRALGDLLSTGSCQLEELSLHRCRITDKGLAVIAMALEDPFRDDSNHPNHPGRSGGSDTSRMHTHRSTTSTNNSPPQSTLAVPKRTSSDPGDGHHHPSTTTQSPLNSSTLSSAWHPPAQEFVTTLNLSHNKIGGHGIKIFAKYISRCESLRRLDLSYNVVGCMGCDVEGVRLPESFVPLDDLVRTLSSLSTLESLNLSHCDLGRLPTDIGRLLTPSFARRQRAAGTGGGGGGTRAGRASISLSRRASTTSDHHRGGGGGAAPLSLDAASFLDGPTDHCSPVFPDTDETFKELHLSGNPRLGDAGAAALADALRSSGIPRVHVPDSTSSPYGTPMIGSPSSFSNNNNNNRSPITNKMGGGGVTMNNASSPPLYLPLEVLAVCDCGISMDGMRRLLEALSPQAPIMTSPPSSPHQQHGGAENANIKTLARSHSLGSMGMSLNPEGVVGGSTLGYPVRSLRLLQAQWKAWKGPLVDNLIRIPSLESVDLGKFSTPQLIAKLKENVKERSRQAFPEYERHVKLVEREGLLISEANDHVKDEKKATDRALDNVKNSRERQKATLAALEQEIHQLRQQVTNHQQEYEDAQDRLRDNNDHLDDKKAHMETAKSRLLKRIETIEMGRRDYLAQMKSLKSKCQKHSQQVSTGVGDCRRGNERQFKVVLEQSFGGGEGDVSRRHSLAFSKQSHRASGVGTPTNSQAPSGIDTNVDDGGDGQSDALVPTLPTIGGGGGMVPATDALVSSSSAFPALPSTSPFSVGSQSAVLAEIQTFLWEQELLQLEAETAELKSTALLYEAKIKAAHARFPDHIPPPTVTPVGGVQQQPSATATGGTPSPMTAMIATSSLVVKSSSTAIASNSSSKARPSNSKKAVGTSSSTAKPTKRVVPKA